MGCDIHAVIEYCRKRQDGDEREPHWMTWATVSPGRNYAMFTAMAGVRGEEGRAIVQPRGIPARVSFGVMNDYYLYVTENTDGDPQSITQEKADKYLAYGSTRHPTMPQYISGPDWHSASWLTTAEMEQVMTRYLEIENEYIKERNEQLAEMRKNPPGGIDLATTLRWTPETEAAPDPAYQAIISAMKVLESGKCEARIVFWFDN